MERMTRRLVLAALAALASSVAAPLAARALSPTAPSPTDPSPAAAPGRLAPRPAGNALLEFGVATAGGPLAAAELDAVADLAGEQPHTVMFYKDFRQPPPVAELAAAARRGAVPLVTWEPWEAGRGLVQPLYSLRRIARGAFDGYLAQWGRALAEHGGPVILRFAHEMNGSWYPWCAGVNGTTPASYAAAWRRVRSVVTAAGATNVQWLWCPNAPYPGSSPLAPLYPGGATVDLVGLDAYNWGTSQAWSRWTSPGETYGPGLAALRSVAPGMPILVAETACAEQGGSKPAWISEAIGYLSAQDDVRGFVWFNLLKETDWRIESSAESAAAFAAALAGRA